MPRKRKPETPPPERLSGSDVTELRKWLDEHADHHIRALRRKGPGGAADLVEECLNWHRREDIWRRDWQATYRNWIKKHVRWQVERRQTEKPQYDLASRESGPGSVTHISDVLRHVK